MMNNLKCYFFTLLLWLIFVPGTSTCFAQPVSSVELITNASKYDGSSVVYQGEVIGDLMVRGEYAWINVNDGKNAIGIWILKEFTEDILYSGSYKARGDLVEVAGKFNRACADHGGDLDIHAYSVRKVSPGNIISHAVNRKRIYFTLGLLLILIGGYALRFVRLAPLP